MSVEFDENDGSAQLSTDPLRQPKPSFLIRLVLKFRIAKNEYAARAILLITALIFFVGSIVLFAVSSIKPRVIVLERSQDPNAYKISPDSFTK